MKATLISCRAWFDQVFLTLKTVDKILKFDHSKKKPLSSTFQSVTCLIYCAKWHITLYFEPVDEILKCCDCWTQLCSDNNLSFIYIGCPMEIIVINKLMVCLTIWAPLFTECRVIVLRVRLCFCTYTPQSWKPLNIPVFVCAEKNRVNCSSRATDK